MLTFAPRLVRAAAYELLAEADREVAHRRAASWLALHGEQDHLALARHFELGGQRDKASSHFARADTDASGALRLLSRDVPTVVLSHNPDVQDLPIWDGVRGWVLAGHTHGGQVKPPFLPPPILPVNNRRYTAGAFDVGPGRTMYINRGLGFLHQVRFGVRPELTLFTLARAPAAVG